MTEIFKAASVDEAKALAAKKFGKDVKTIRFEIIDEGKKGLFGIGKKEAVVKATYDIPEKKAEAPVKSVVKDEPEKKETSNLKVTHVKKESEPVKKEASASSEEEMKPETVKSEAEAANNDEEEFSLDNFTLIEDESLVNPKVKLAKDYITSILSAMEIEAEYKVYQNEKGAVIDIQSSNNGTIIGRRGETLDAVQYLCSIIANKGDKDYFRITIDCLGYRSKRKETLEQLAAKVAKSVLRTGRSQPLEPMNPYERRVIHSAISKIEGVSSRSVGDEPYRKIIVSSNNPRYGGKRRDNRRDDRRNRNHGNSRNSEKEVSMERKSVNLATSFEKDYKRPKPEDSIEGGLYGKIEL